MFTNIIKYFTGGERKMGPVGPSLFVNHGGGPLPVLGYEEYNGLTVFLRDEIKKYMNFKEVKAVILVTAHWEEDIVSISSCEHHDLYFDYYNFPPESYTFEYNAPGYPELAERIHESLKKAGIKSRLDSERGWDHGLFVPMMLINPAADIPIVQVSILKNQDAEQHYKLGQALCEFRKEGVAIIGSGMSYHNTKELKTAVYQGDIVNREFDDYLNKICTAENEKDRMEGFLSWRQQPGATEALPLGAASHFMPLIVIAGAGGSKPGDRVFNWDLCDMFRLSGFNWKDV